MLLDARNTSEVADGLHAQIAIVGAGTVGIFLASLLAGRGQSVLVLDAGGPIATSDRNKQTAVSIGKYHSGPSTSRASGLGGTSVLWGGQLAEFEPRDLSRTLSAWPIGYDKLRDLYDRVYDYFGLVGRRTMAEYRTVFGHEVESDGDIERFFTLWLRNPNFASLFRKEILNSRRVTYVTNASVRQLRFVNDVATEAVARTPNGREIGVTAGQFVFAAGTIANSRFFLAAQREGGVPWQENSNVGHFFQDHLGGRIAEVEVMDEKRFRAAFENGVVGGIKLQPKLKFRGRAGDEAAIGIAGMFAFRSDLGEHVANVKHLAKALRTGAGLSKLRHLPRDMVRLNRAFLPFVMRYIRDRRVFAFFDKGVEFGVQAEQIPLAASRITLENGPSGPDGLPRAQVDWQVDGRELVSIRRFAAAADAYLRRHAIARLAVEPALANDDFVGRLADTGHQCGGLRMAEDASLGVTDADCRVFGTRNVSVAGAALFPTSSHANCTLTALALAVRLSDRLASDTSGRHRA